MTRLARSAPSPLAARSAEKLYERVADRIASLIDGGTLRVGQRVPSVRKLSAQLDVSISTVLAAYRVLEDRGRLAAKPQSGYYVRPRAAAPPVEPAPSAPRLARATVRTGDLVVKFMQDSVDPRIVPLGAAIGMTEGPGNRQVARLAAAIARRAPAAANGYAIAPGVLTLRQQVARKLMDAGCAVAPDDLVVTIGGQEAINLCLRAVAREGDAIAIDSPTFFGTLQTLDQLGMKVVEIPTHPRHGVSVEAVAEAIDTAKVKACLFITNFQNPLGACMPDAAKKKLVELLARRDVPLIEDDIYGDLHFGPDRPRTCKSYDAKGNVLLCSSFSKTLAPGYRVGWCAPGRHRDAVLRLKTYTTLATPTLPQMAIADFIAAGGYEHHLRRMRRTYAQQCARMAELVAHHFPAGTKVTRPTGGFVLWVEMPEDVDAMALYERALAERISIAPGPLFSAAPKYRNFIRLNCGMPWDERIDPAIETVGRLIGEMRRGGSRSGPLSP